MVVLVIVTVYFIMYVAIIYSQSTLKRINSLDSHSTEETKHTSLQILYDQSIYSIIMLTSVTLVRLEVLSLVS